MHHSFCSLPYDRSIASSEAISPHSAISCFLFRLFVTSSSSCLHILHFPITSNPSFLLPTPQKCFRRQFLRKMWQIQLYFILFIVHSTFLSSLTLCNTSPLFTPSVHLIFSIILQHHISKLSMYFSSTFWSVQVSPPYKAMFQMLRFSSFFLKFKRNLLAKRTFFLLNAAFAMAILNLISRVHLASFFM